MRQFLLVFLCWAVALSGAPLEKTLIHTEKFYGYCDHHYNYDKAPLRPLSVKKHDLIFVNEKCLDSFFRRIHPQIRVPYILVTDGNGPGSFAPYLDDPKIKAWFGSDLNMVHPKVHKLPCSTLEYASDFFPAFAEIVESEIQKLKLVYIPFFYTNEGSQLLDKPFTSSGEAISALAFYRQIKEAHFILLPHLESANDPLVWIALHLGAIPIVKRSVASPLLEDLPILLVDDFNALSEKSLIDDLREIEKKRPNLQKLTIDYWFDLIDGQKKSPIDFID